MIGENPIQHTKLGSPLKSDNIPKPQAMIEAREGKYTKMLASAV